MIHLPLLWLSLAFLLGINLSARVQLHWGWWLGIAIVLSSSSWFVRRLTRNWYASRRWQTICPFPALLLLGVVSFGAARLQLAQPVLSPHQVSWYSKYGEVVLHGKVSAFPDIRSNAVLLRVKVDSVNVKQDDTVYPVKGYVLVRLPWNPDWQVDDRVTFQGVIEEPPQGENFDYRDYLARHQIYAYMAYPKIIEIQSAELSSLKGFLWKLRNTAEERLYRMLPNDEAALLDGILLGNERNIPTDLATAFRNTGTSHIIAISGFNITIISALIIKLFSRLFRKRSRAFWFTILAITLYTLLVGAQPPVVRAAIMGCMGLMGSLLGRRQVGMNSLVFTAAVMTAITPGLFRDASFQLSFAATMGLILLGDPLTHGFNKIIENRLPALQNSIITKGISEYILLTLAAQITTLPVIAYHFQQFPLIGLIANPLILPPQPLVMILGGLMVIFGLVWFPLGQLFAWLAWPAVAYTIKMVSGLAEIGGQPVALQAFSFFGIILFYLLFFLLVFRKKVPLSFQQTAFPPMLLLITALLAVSTWRPALARLDERVHIVIPSGKTAETILVQLPSGASWIISSGNGSTETYQEFSQWQVSPNNRITGVIWLAENLDRKNVSALSYRIPGIFLTREEVLGSKYGSELFSRSTDWGAQWNTIVPGTQIALQDSVVVTIAEPCQTVCASLIRYGNFELLVPAGNSYDYLENLLVSARATPEVILLSATQDDPSNWLGTLAQDAPLLTIVTDRTTSLQENELSTQISGWMDISTDGTSMWIQTQH